MFTIPFLLYLGLSPFIFILFSLESRKPIFGSRKIRYGETPREKDCFPIFDPRRKRVHILPSQKALRRRIALLWLIALLFTSLIAFFGLFGRVCLTQEHHIISYNAVNQESPVSYTPEDYSHLTLQTKYVTGYRSPSYWKYELTIEMTDGRSFSFSDRNFDRRVPDHADICLKHMTTIKALFPPGRITILGQEDIEKVADDCRLSDEQRLLLQNLFVG